MIKNVSLLFCLLVMAFVSNAQLKISKEKTSTPPKFSKGDYIGNIFYNDDWTTTLHYVEKQPFMVYFKNYTYDQDFNLVNHDIDMFLLEDQLFPWRKKFEWFNYRGEDYTVQGISIDPTWGGKLVARKKITTWKYRNSIRRWWSR